MVKIISTSPATVNLYSELNSQIDMTVTTSDMKADALANLLESLLDKWFNLDENPELQQIPVGTWIKNSLQERRINYSIEYEEDTRPVEYRVYREQLNLDMTVIALDDTDMNTLESILDQALKEWEQPVNGSATKFKYVEDQLIETLHRENIKFTVKFNNKPDCKLIGENGNIFNLMAIASRILKANDLEYYAKEIKVRIIDKHEARSYDEALAIIMEYVNVI